MSRDASDLRFVAANTLKNAQLESTENEFDNSMNSIHFPPPRTPLNTIPDPSQFQREFQELDFDSKDRFGAARAGRSSDRKIEVLENLLSLNKVIGNVSNCGTPRVSGRGKAQSEPSSAQSTPARSISRTLNGGVVGACSGHRPPPYSVGKGGSSSRVSRGISNPMSEPLVEVPHFEIVEDPSFWMDHNVQVRVVLSCCLFCCYQFIRNYLEIICGFWKLFSFPKWKIIFSNYLFLLKERGNVLAFCQYGSLLEIIILSNEIVF